MSATKRIASPSITIISCGEKVRSASNAERSHPTQALKLRGSLMEDLQRELVGRTRDGQEVERFTLRSSSGLVLRAISLGATVTELLVPDRDGRSADVVLGFDDLDAYQSHSPYFGCVVGRVAFRIAHACFTLDGTTYRLTRNSGEHHLHGGPRGFSWRVWQAELLARADGPAVRFRIVSNDGDQGYPGRVQAEVVYQLADDHSFRIEYQAVTDRPTPINMTHHGYFNLAGAGAGDVLKHTLQIEADRYSETDAETLPTGRLVPVGGTPLDFQQTTRIGQRVGEGTGRVPGYDLAYCLRSAPGQVRRIASLGDPTSGRTMDVLTDAPALVLYTGNQLDGSLHGKSGYHYPQFGGVCLETGNLPGAVHHTHFPPITVRPEQAYRHTCIYRFRV
jgi:aldose 1-epimerase